MNIRIEKFSVTNYRSCLRTAFEPNPNLSALIGRNASGKSSILNALLLLRSVFRKGRVNREAGRASSKSRLAVALKCGRHTVALKADVFHSTTETGRDEVGSGRIYWNIKDFSGVDDWFALPLPSELEAMLGFAEAHRMDIERAARFFPIQYKLPKRGMREFQNTFRAINAFIGGISYYSASQFTDPSKCPVSLEIEDERVRRNYRTGGEHTRFLQDLFATWSLREKGKAYQEFFNIVGPEGLKLVDKIYFRELELPQSRYVVGVGGKVVRERSERSLLIPFFIVDGNKLSPNQLSEGTFKTIALIFYLVIDKGTLLLIEEPEVCIHHGLLNSILALVRSYSARKQIIISTHSDFVLDLLQPENVFLVKKDVKRGTCVKSVPSYLSAQDFKALRTYLAESGNLGEYWRQGALTND